MAVNSNPMFFPSDDWLTILFRLGIALLIGGVIGLDREQPSRPAGLRTYMIVSLGAAIFVMITLQAGLDLNSTNALSRTIQGIATGVGFIGAGLIFQQSKPNLKPKVKGLTSAAALWLTAGLGTATGCGLWQMSLIGTLMTLLILRGFKKVKVNSIYRLRVYRPFYKQQRIHRHKTSTNIEDIQSEE
ncbi:MAG: MgtC/SapB family protein [Planktothrix sp. GU0601_MAG3]|nr:MAG: MgtC/SapB family protein [Planktothrix sp. GU0601_MAG3]